MTISHNLVPIDFSEDSLQAFRTACELARRFAAKLDLLNVIEPLPPAADLMLINAYDDIRRDAEEDLAKLPCAELPADSVQRFVRVGYAAQTITDFARGEGIDLIVIGTCGRTGLAHLLMGSVAERVVRTAPCPVFVARRKPQTVPDAPPKSTSP